VPEGNQKTTISLLGLKNLSRLTIFGRMDKQTDRQTDNFFQLKKDSLSEFRQFQGLSRVTDRPTDKLTDRQTDRHTDMQTDRA
jgi:hypothetical protein